MKFIFIVNCCLLFICAGSCNAGNREDAETKDAEHPFILPVVSIDSFPTGKLLPHILCLADTTESYALYIPAKNNASSSPVIYFFDPHADGAVALSRYTSLADRYGFILVASNNSKNGNDWPTEEHSWNNLYKDVQLRFQEDTARIYVCGFSGGAKAATYFGLMHNEISAVIACGAVLPELATAENPGFSFTAISGEGDMNRSEMIEMNNSLNKGNSRHRILFFEGIHEWPPAPVMEMAFAGLQLDAMAKKITPLDYNFINNYIKQRQKSITALSNNNQQERAMTECTFSINLLTGLTDSVNWFIQKSKVISNSKAYQQQLAGSNQLQQREQEIKAGYQVQFEQGDLHYWQTTINDLMVRAKATGAEAAMYQRLKAFLSLAFYSISNQTINSKQDAVAAHFVSLYKMVDSTNPEAWYFSAILDARAKNTAQANADLLTAVNKGFNDMKRLQQQPEFAGMNIAELANKMK